MIREVLDRISLFEKRLTADGTCFIDSQRYMDEHKNLKLVHGLVTGQGDIEGIRYNHSWVEDGDTVIDPAAKERGKRTYKFPKELYYAIGDIKENTTFRYTYKEMIKNMIKTENYGPWEPVLIKNKY
ncbi:MAG: hypothetical protein KAI79_12320 [Bacteroidales bacterium]|nr:hypothetical protein [Bacteroidales bacterium]